jgi:hypothetical protein
VLDEATYNLGFKVRDWREVLSWDIELVNTWQNDLFGQQSPLEIE